MCCGGLSITTSWDGPLKHQEVMSFGEPIRAPPGLPTLSDVSLLVVDDPRLVTRLEVDG